MNLYQLIPNSGSRNKKKRLGRGQGSGKGGTCTRGHKGAKSRSGNVKKIGFEGGQMPLQRRLPKFGFKKYNKKSFTSINLYKIQLLVDSGRIQENILNRNIFFKYGLIKNKNQFIKILGIDKNKQFNKKLTIIANSFSKEAIRIIQSAGGEYKIASN